MAGRVVLHVGAMKSGTSFLQTHLFEHADELARHGVLLPGGRYSQQVSAVVDLLGRPSRRGDVSGTWAELVAEAAAWPGIAVISMEFLGPAPRDRIERVVHSFPGAEVTVVITARDLNRNLAAMWQESVQNGSRWSWQEFRDGARQDRPRPDYPAQNRTAAGRHFWRQQNVARMARQWLSAVGPGNLTLVTLPPPDADPRTLLRRFASVIGPEVLLTPTAATPVNPSVGAPSAEVLRRMNELLEDRGLPRPHGAELRKQLLAKGILAHRRDVEPPIGLPVMPWVSAYARRTVRTLQDMELRLVGDWNDLTPVPVPGVSPDEVPAEQLLDAALAGLTGLMEREIRLRHDSEPDEAEAAVHGSPATTA